jgi:hypothetical protein
MSFRQLAAGLESRVHTFCVTTIRILKTNSHRRFLPYFHIHLENLKLLTPEFLELFRVNSNGLH